MTKKFQTNITEKDELPELDKFGLEKFLLDGYDPELGWVRKPFTSGFEQGKYGTTMFRINEKGARFNLDYERLPIKISIYGDSFAMSRQVNDNETIAHYLSRLTNSNVLNFGVGNYSIDQAFLRLKRESQKNKTEINILAFVPEQILRVMSYWKHYLEYGNHFGFKPRYKLDNGNLTLIPNIMDSKEKFNHLGELLPLIQENDYWYLKKFKKDFEVIYTFDQLMESNLNWRINSYQDKECFETLLGVVNLFKEYSKNNHSNSMILVLPYKNDILFYKSNNKKYYSNFINACKEILPTVDSMDDFINLDKIDDYFSDDSQYGGHYSKKGNEFIAEQIYHKLI